MTFLEIQNQVMDRLNLTSDDARTRIKTEINLRYAEVQSSVNLSRTRRSVLQFTTVSGNSLTTCSGIAKVLSIFDPVYLMRPLQEVSLNEIRLLDAPSAVQGIPYLYAIQHQEARSVTLRLFPQPQQVQTLQSDALVSGTNMTADDDEPAFPEDFHDILVLGPCADELLKMDNQRLAQEAMEKRFEKRLGELRYFIIKSTTLNLSQRDSFLNWGLSARVWPFANL